jgi:M6 family metalloprotease-like protein
MKNRIYRFLVMCAFGWGIIPLLPKPLSAQEASPPTLETFTPRLGWQANAAGWISARWSCGRSSHKMEYVLLQPNAPAIPLDIPQKYLDTYGGMAGINKRFFYLHGDMAPRADGKQTLFVETMARDPQIRDKWDMKPAKDRFTTQAVQTKPFVLLLVRFKDVTATPKPKSYYEGMIGSTSPGLRHYYLEDSFNQLDIAGSTVIDWINLPGTKASYMAGTDIDYDKVIRDATAAVDSQVDFRKFYGIAVMLNTTFSNQWWGLGTAQWLTLDGETRTWGTSIQATPHDQSLCAHETGHSLGLMHSSGPYSETYDSKWDVMSGGDANISTTYGYVADHTISFHKAFLGWIPTNRICLVKPGTSQTINIERLAQPVSSTNYLMGQVFIGGLASKFYTVEFRQKIGYDTILPASGVVIHSVDTKRAGGDRLAQVVDATNNNDCNDAGAIWLAGETFTDATNGITIKVNSIGTSSANVTITQTGTGDLPDTVKNTKDSGAGSLRNALDYANIFFGTTITFKIPTTDPNFLSGVATITPLSDLPDLNLPGTILDGASQTTNIGDTNLSGPEIHIRGTSNASGYGLSIYSPNNIVRNIVWTKFTNFAISLNGADAKNNRIEKCYLGTDPTGSTASGNGWTIGLLDNSNNNFIGDVGAGNLISGNTSAGVYITGSTTTNNIIRGNLIGTDRTGTKALPNGYGIQIRGGSSKTTIDQNLVSGNSSVGIGISGSNLNVITANTVGPTLPGTAALSNSWGIYLADNATSNTIGGTTLALGNIVSGNSVGVGIVGASKTTLLFNYVGLDKTGKKALPNSYGVYLKKGATFATADNIIGSSSAGNFLSGNSTYGLVLEGALRTTVRGNVIGLMSDRSTALGNANHGIWINTGASNNSIMGNVISSNLTGVSVTGDTSLSNLIRQNSIFGNTKLGIDLDKNNDAKGITLNDLNDVDTGPNNLQNFPVITKVTKSATTPIQYTYEGTLNSRPNTTYIIDLYGNLVAHLSGYGEARYWLGSVTVTTNANGNATFSLTTTNNRKYLSATATNTTLGETSEFAKIFTTP